MADKDAGHSMFGLNDDEPTRQVPDPTPQATTQPGAPQYVYVQQPPQPAPALAARCCNGW